MFYHRVIVKLNAFLQSYLCSVSFYLVCVKIRCIFQGVKILRPLRFMKNSSRLGSNILRA